MEIMIALLLFAGLIVCWLLLPGSTTVQTTPEMTSVDTPVGHSTAGQPA